MHWRSSYATDRFEQGAIIEYVRYSILGLVFTFIGLSAVVIVEQDTVSVMTLSGVWILAAFVVALVLLFKPRGQRANLVTLAVAGAMVALAISQADAVELRSVRWQLVLLGETALAVLLVQLVSHIDLRLDEASERMALAAAEHDGALLETFDFRHPYLREQMARSRRYETPLSVLIVRATDAAYSSLSKVEADVRRLVDRTHAMDAVAASVLQDLRASDRMFRDDVMGHLVLVCPETDGASAQLLLERIVKDLAAPTGSDVAVGKATFPDEALMLEELVDLAEQACERSDRAPLREAHGEGTYAQRVGPSVAAYEEGR